MKKQVYSERRIRYLFKELRMHRYRKKWIYRKVWCLIINRLYLCTGNNSKTSIYLIDRSSWVLVPRNPSNAANLRERGSKLGFWSASFSKYIYIYECSCRRPYRSRHRSESSGTSSATFIDRRRVSYSPRWSLVALRCHSPLAVPLQYPSIRGRCTGAKPARSWVRSLATDFTCDRSWDSNVGTQCIRR